MHSGPRQQRRAAHPEQFYGIAPFPKVTFEKNPTGHLLPICSHTTQNTLKRDQTSETTAHHLTGERLDCYLDIAREIRGLPFLAFARS